MKNKVLWLTAFLSSIFTGCKAASFTSQEQQIELNGNPTTGYTWTFEAGDSSVISVDEKITYLGAEGMTGAPSSFIYTVRSLKAGNTTLRFEYKRPWETVPAAQVRNFKVTVTSTGKIEISEESEAEKSFKSVSMKEGLELMKADTDFVLLDVRRPEEYSAGHIPGAVLLTNETFTAEDASKVIPKTNTRVYVYCRSGRRSKQASEKLAGFGYTSVIEIGGILDYSGEIEK